MTPRARYSALLDALSLLPSVHLRPALSAEERRSAEAERERLEEEIEALPAPWGWGAPPPSPSML